MLQRRIIVTPKFLEDLIVSISIHYPKETMGALSGGKTNYHSRNQRYRDLRITRPWPYEHLKRNISSLTVLSDREINLKNLILHRRDEFLGTYHNHSYPTLKLPKNPKLSETDKDEMHEYWEELEKFAPEIPIEEYLELLLCIRRTFRRTDQLIGLNYREFPTVYYFPTPRSGFETKLSCFCYDLSNKDENHKTKKPVSLKRTKLLLKL